MKRTGSASEIFWLSTFQGALEEAGRTRKPLFLDFWEPG